MADVVTSILFESPAERARAEQGEVPACFADLNLDQLVQAITTDWAEYDLKPFFYVPLSRVAAIMHRQEVMRDLERPAVLDSIKAFAEKLRSVRAHLMQAGKLHYKRQKDAWHLDAVDIYCRAVTELADNLRASRPRSRGLVEFLEHLGQYIVASQFVSLAAEAKALGAILARIRYCVHVRGSSFTVSPYRSEPDYSAQVEETFERFARSDVKDYRIKYTSSVSMNHIEAKILEYVSELEPGVFSALDAFCANNIDFMDATTVTFDREIHFYIAYLHHITKFSCEGLPFCYPQISATEKSGHCTEGFDLALATRLGKTRQIVRNDFQLRDEERIIVVTGPNQGGKTTFVRMFGQVLYLAGLGCPIPGRQARLPLFDRIFTHFEREERTENLRGKLQDELVRIRAIYDQATSASIIILNEILTSTTLQDAMFLSWQIMEKIIDLDALCAWVTFIDELAAPNDRVVSMASTVDPQNPTLRTFKILRRPPDGLAHAVSIAEKYQLTYERLKERLSS
ncbi:MAG TPA: DNA mismatch repair protein MutS [Xanthobacteraceae bacterium]|nr:DNA mismatch repair protein MutS [Xanthobacteraceae bacterium]